MGSKLQPPDTNREQELVIPDHCAPSVRAAKDPVTKMFLPHAGLEILAQRAKKAFSLHRYSYAQLRPRAGKRLIRISIVTRSYNNPYLLKRSVDLMKLMLDYSFEHVVLEDEQGLGMQMAETALYAFRHQFKGDYICHVDNDDYVSDYSFVGDMVAHMEQKPALIIFRVKREDGRLFPAKWKEFPIEGDITTSNVLFRRDLYQNPEITSALSQPHAGDYACIYNALIYCQRNHLPILWVDHTYIFVTMHGSLLNDPVQSIADRVQTPEYFVTVDRLQQNLPGQMSQIATAYAYAKRYEKTLVWWKWDLEESRSSDLPMFSWITQLECKKNWNDVDWTEFPERQEHNVRLQDSSYTNKTDRLAAKGETTSKKSFIVSPTFFQPYREDLRHLFTKGYRVTLPERNESLIAVALVQWTNFEPEWYLILLESLQEEYGADRLQVYLFGDDLPSELGFRIPSSIPEDEQIVMMSQCDERIVDDSEIGFWATFLSKDELK